MGTALVVRLTRFTMTAKNSHTFHLCLICCWNMRKTSRCCRVGVPFLEQRACKHSKGDEKGERKVSFPASQWNKLFFKLHLQVSAVGKPRLIEYRSQTKVETFYFTSIEHFFEILESALTLWVCSSLVQPGIRRVLKTIKPYKKSQNSGTENPLPFIWEKVLAVNHDVPPHFYTK